MYRRRVGAACLVLSLAIGGTAPGVADAATKRSTAASRRAEVRRQKARKAAEINVLKASDRQIERALDTLTKHVAQQIAAAATAQRAAESAARAAAAARAEEARLRATLARQEAALRTYAVHAYVRGPSDALLTALDAPSLGDVATRRHFLDVALADAVDTIDEMRATREDLADKRAAAEAADTRAAQRRRDTADRLRDSKEAKRLQSRVAADVEARLERALAEAAGLETLDRQLANDIARRQASLARRIPAGSTKSRAGRQVGSVSTTVVGGIEVATSIAGNVGRLLDAARAAGFSLGGGGYRSSDGQVAARRAHCGSSNYDIYDKPASQCRPPTARPGQSMHERGLAIDFTSGGRLINSHSNPAWKWLNANAGRFGLHNLKSEPWHWSTNGN
ncbi:MAG TPA: M15 family metallopeptidase [Acidimicrobiales bacterium]|nr:M15 family metallopeptidase [Acidimicrobiales bacterium]